MRITTKKCDVCGTRHDSDQPGYNCYGQFTTLNGERLDVCAECGLRLLEPLARRPRTETLPNGHTTTCTCPNKGS